MQDLTCAKCSKLSSKILALQCQHSLCLFCASQALQRCLRSRSRDKQKQGQIQCQICGSISIVHKSSLTQLLPPSSSPKPHSHQKSSPPPRSDSPRFQNQSMLFCLNCQRTCFTIDDYLSGMHAGHQVKNVKRSGSLLKQMLGEINERVKQKIQIATNESNKLVERKRDLVENFGYTKKMLKQHFEKIRVLLEDKEQEMMNLVEELMVGLFSQVDSSIIQTKNCLSKYQLINHQINDNLQISNTVKAFNFYSDRKQQILREISFSIQQFTRQTLNSAQLLNMNTGILHDCYEMIKRMKLTFADVSLPPPLITHGYQQSRQVLHEDFFEAKKNQVFNQTMKKEFREGGKNATLNTVKSMEMLRVDKSGGNGIGKSRAGKGVNERLRELELLISRPSQTGYRQHTNKFY